MPHLVRLVADLLTVKVPTEEESQLLFLEEAKKAINSLASRVVALEAGPEEWHEIGIENNPVFLNAWINYNGATHNTAAFYKDSHNRVWLKGLIKNGSIAGVVFILPIGYKPNLRTNFSSIDGTGTPSARVEINIDGTVNVLTGNNAFIALDGMSFRVI